MSLDRVSSPSFKFCRVSIGFCRVWLVSFFSSSPLARLRTQFKCTGFYWVFRGLRKKVLFRFCSELLRVSTDLTVFNRALLGFTAFYRVLLGFTRFYWVLLSFTGFYWVLLGFTGTGVVFHNLSASRIWWDIERRWARFSATKRTTSWLGPINFLFKGNGGKLDGKIIGGRLFFDGFGQVCVLLRVMKNGGPNRSTPGDEHF